MTIPSSRTCKYCVYASTCEANKGPLRLLEKTVQNYKKGDYIVNQGQPYDGLYILCNGMIKGTVRNQRHEERIVGFSHPESVLGLSGLSRGHYQENIEALGYVSMLKINKDALEISMQHSPELASQILKLMSNILVRDQQQFSALNSLEAERRLLYFLEEACAEVRKTNAQQELLVSRLDIANYLGIAVETLSRLIKKLASQGIIRADRRSISLLNQAT